MKTCLRGFTLLEALVALGVAAILLAIAVPAWSAAVARVHSVNAQAAMTATLVGAIRHATVTSTEVVVCPSPDAAHCSPGMDWTGGWFAYADLDGDRQHGANETIVHRQDRLTGGVRLRSTVGRTRLVFQPGGSNAGSNVTFTLCDNRGTRAATSLVLSNGGQLRTGTPTFAAASQCVYGPG